MIKISQIKISNFRSFTNEENIIRELDVLNIFAGRNNVGKTNVLRAINLFLTQNPTIQVLIEMLLRRLLKVQVKILLLQ